jgi:hypothetical protein
MLGLIVVCLQINERIRKALIHVNLIDCSHKKKGDFDVNGTHTQIGSKGIDPVAVE